MLAIPDAEHVRGAAVGRPEGRRGAGVLRHPQPRRHAVRGRPAPGAAPQPAAPPANTGFTFYVAPDIEFFYFAPPEKGQAPTPLDEGGFFDLTTTDVAGTLRKQTIRTLETMSIPVEYSFHEDCAEPARDRPAPHRRAHDGRQRHDVPAGREGGRRQRRACTPRSCPSRSRACRAAGMHMHLSLFDGDDNAFYDDDDPYNLSPVAKQFMAGLLRHAAEITAITNQTVNSYKRLVPGLRGAGAHQLGAQQPQRARSACRSPSAATPAPPASSTARPTRRATRTSRSACCSPPACAASPRATSCPPRPTPTCSRWTTPTLAKLGIDAAAAVAQRRAEGDGAARRSCTRRSASTSSSGSCATSAREWRAYKTHVSAVRARPLPEGAL